MVGNFTSPAATDTSFREHTTANAKLFWDNEAEGEALIKGGERRGGAGGEEGGREKVSVLWFNESQGTYFPNISYCHSHVEVQNVIS